MGLQHQTHQSGLSRMRAPGFKRRQRAERWSAAVAVRRSGAAHRSCRRVSGMRLRAADLGVVGAAEVFAFGILEPAVELGLHAAFEFHSETRHLVAGFGFDGLLLSGYLKLGSGDGE